MIAAKGTIIAVSRIANTISFAFVMIDFKTVTGQGADQQTDQTVSTVSSSGRNSRVHGKDPDSRSVILKFSTRYVPGISFPLDTSTLLFVAAHAM